MALADELEKIEKQTKVHQIKISDLNAELIGCMVETKVQVVGEASQKGLPKKVKLTCRTCGYTEEIIFEDLERSEKATFLTAVIFGKGDKLGFLAKDQQCKKGPHRFSCQNQDYMDFSILFVRDLLDPLVKFDSRVYQTRKIYLVNQRIPYAKKIKIQGEVYLEPSNKNITIFGEKAEAYEDEVRNFEVTDEDKNAWNKHFEDKEPEELLNQIALGMVGRPHVKEGLLLGLHSVAVIQDIYGSPIRGTLRIMFFGDTKTYKSKAGKDLTIEHYGLGDYVIGESSSRTGITYSIDNDNKALIWGALPLNDLGFMVLDGIQSIYKQEWHETREALESQRVIVRRSLSGEALARVRVVGIINPGTRTQRPMSTYLFKCQGLMDTYIFSDPPDVTRWDLFFPFSSDDVPKKEIAEAKPSERPIPDQIFVRHVFWVWSRKSEDVIYTEEAKKKIREEAQVFMDDFAADSVPIIHLGYREVLTRVSVAYAALMHSTDIEHKQVRVKVSHVEKAVSFLKEIAESLDLGVFKLEEEGKRVILVSEMGDIIADLDETALKILDLIKVTPRNSGELAEELDTTPRTIKRRYAILRKHHLINTTPGQGVSLTARGVNFLKQYLGDKGTKNVTSEGEKGTQNGTMSLAKVEAVKKWILENRKDGAISTVELAEFISKQGVNPQKIVEKLKADSFLFELPDVFKWGVVYPGKGGTTGTSGTEEKEKPPSPERETRPTPATSDEQLEQILRRIWRRGTTEAFYQVIHENSDYDRVQAAEFLARLIDQNKMGYDKDGSLVWSK